MLQEGALGNAQDPDTQIWRVIHMRRSGEFSGGGQNQKRRVAVLAVLLMAVCFLAMSVLESRETAVVEADSQFFVRDDQKLILYTSHKPEVYGPLVQEFEERTGIWVEVKNGGTIELMEMIAAEDGEPTCDVMFGGGVESYEAYREYFDTWHFRESDRLLKDFCSVDDRWTAFSQLPIVFIYHNKLVGETDAPRTWEALLKDRWKGRIAFADPQNSGTSCTALLTMCQVLELEPRELVKDFADVLDGGILPDSQLVIDEVTQGTKLIGVTLEESAMKAQKQGADISIVYPEDGISAVPDGAALLKDAPHIENARLFLDFIVSRDVQELLGDSLCRRSVRTDIGKKEGFPEITVMDFDINWAGSHQKELLGWWKDQVGQGGPL